MRILAVTNLYPRPGHETKAQFNRQQFLALSAEHEVSLIVPVAWTEELSDRLRGRPTPARIVNVDGMDVRYPVYYYPPKLLQHRYGEFFRESIRRPFARAVGEFKPDAVLSCFAHPDGWAAVRLAHAAGLPAVIKIVGSDVLVLGRDGRRRARIAEALKEADGIASVSLDLADHAIALGADPRRLSIVPEGVDTGLFRPRDRAESRLRLGLPPGGPMILFVGNILLSKGAGVLVDACARLARGGLEFTCYLVGRGRDEAEVRATVARQGLSGRVVLAGARPLSELPDWYGASDVVTLPSYSEGIPNVLREAQACGRAIVATRVGGIPEIAEPSSSILVPPGSPGDLAEALGAALGGDVAGGDGRGFINWEESGRRLADSLRQASARYSDERGNTDEMGRVSVARPAR